MELVRVTESAALAAARWVGRGNKDGADAAAVEAMRLSLSSVQMDGVVVIGEGEKDHAPMLFNGEKVGDGHEPLVDVAVDPIDGTTLTAKGLDNALSVIAVSERGTMFDPGPSFYMQKIAVGPECVGAIDITASVTQNLRWIAKSKQESVRDLTVVILDRPRHDDLIDEVALERRQNPPDHRRRRLRRDRQRLAGRRDRRADRHRRHARGCHRRRRAEEHGRRDPGPPVPAERTRSGRRLAAAGYDLDRVLTQDDLVQGDNCFFAATGVTDGQLLRGVRFDARGAHTQSLVMRSRSGTVRLIDASHRVRKLQEFSAIDYT